MSNFQSLNLISPILQALEKKGYINPTPIQEQAIPHLLEGKDLLGIAQTGTGKTAAFALPILNHLAQKRKVLRSKKMRVLILTPTRELASQIADNINTYGKSLGLKHAVIFGGVGENPQIAAMQKGLDIIVATPGRLLDLTEQGFVNYDELEIFVLDEADRMLDMGFINDIKAIIRRLPKERQTLFFSATMPRAIADLANSILNNPVRVEITPQSTTVEKIDQRVLFVEKSNKPLLLKHILEGDEVKSVLVFCKMKHGANKVEDFLNSKGIKADAIHGNKSQSARERALQNFRDGKTQVLVATDIAARGIDIPGVTHVINYDIPQEPESYVHRIGRTARAGREGIAIAFCEPLERGLLKAVEKAIKRTIPVDNSHPYFGVEGQVVHRKISSGRSSVGVAASAGAGSAAVVSGRALSRGRDNSAKFSSRNDRNRDFSAGRLGQDSRGRSENRDRNQLDNRGEKTSNSDSREYRKPKSGFADSRYAKSSSRGNAFHANKKSAGNNSAGGKNRANSFKNRDAKKSSGGVKSGFKKIMGWFKK